MTTQSLLEAALQYAGRGWRVIPVYGFADGKCQCGKDCGDSAGKHPRIRKNADGTWGWTDPALIKKHWRRHPHSNIALETGRGLVVVDLDTAEQRELLRSLWTAHGGSPETLAASTGRGAHLYFSGELSGSHYLDDLLIRGASSYVIAPPSNHRSGRTYQWLNAVSLQQFPAWLKELAESYEGEQVTNELAPLLAVELPAYLQPLQQDNKGSSITERAARLDIPPQTPEFMEEVRSALAAVPASCNRETWYFVGMALKWLSWERSDGTSLSYDLWVEWSATCPEKFTEWSCETVWRSFKDDRARPITIGRLFLIARSYGWQQPGEGVLVEPASGAAPATDNSNVKVNGHHAPASVQAMLGPQRILFPDLDHKKRPRPTCHNTALAIRALGVECSHDAFHDKLYVAGHLIDQWAGDLSDNATQILRVLIRKEYGFDPGLTNAHDASVQIALQDSYDPVCDYLDGLRWDGTPRLEKWLTTYMGADVTPLNAAIGRLVLTAAVRRARRPGTKFDQIIVLEGVEGRGKSTAVELLAGAENYSDQRVLTLDDRGQQEAIQGVWLYEIADLTGMRKAEIEAVKVFASRNTDRARPAYGRLRVDRARRCVFFATTNDRTYLKSQTGNRRFWPVLTRHIKLKELARDRDQLWAEAARLEASGASIILPESLWEAAGALQQERMERDPWDDILEQVKGKETPDGIGGIEHRIASRDLIELHLRIPPDRQTDVTAKRLAYTMRRLGWDGPKPIRIGEAVYKGYSRPA